MVFKNGIEALVFGEEVAEVLASTLEKLARTRPDGRDPEQLAADVRRSAQEALDEARARTRGSTW